MDLSGQTDPFGAILGQQGAKAMALERLLHDVQIGWRIIHDQDERTLCCPGRL
jgi:hypothetical protein